MSFDQAQEAAGVGFDGTGDGFSYPTTLPAGDAHLYVAGSRGYPVRCVGVEGGTAQQVSTPEGIRPGDSVQKLLTAYGSRARFVPAPTGGGMTDYAGYVVGVSGGNLVFMLDRARATVIGIAGGGPDVGPNSCTCLLYHLTLPTT
jgi:hypothetical protein